MISRIQGKLPLWVTFPLSSSCICLYNCISESILVKLKLPILNETYSQEMADVNSGEFRRISLPLCEEVIFLIFSLFFAIKTSILETTVYSKIYVYFKIIKYHRYKVHTYLAYLVNQSSLKLFTFQMEFYFQHEKGFVKCNVNEIRWET